ncbi:nitroreductase family protein [Fusobacterium sp. PH5-44]|uniref:nitroreductase family protein n=1 Tax=unclassified Fusobacterium TaxID=2648384 RepID=UPI003D1CCBBA
MNFLSRRSIRKYSEKKVEKEKIQEIMVAAALSPSGNNSRPYEFIVIDDKELIKKLALSKITGGQFAIEAPIMIVVVGHNIIATMEDDCAIASTIIQLKAHDLGLGTCWIQTKNKVNEVGDSTSDVIREILKIPKDIHVNNMIALGYPDEVKVEYTEKDANMKLLHYNRY